MYPSQYIRKYVAIYILIYVSEYLSYTHAVDNVLILGVQERRRHINTFYFLKEKMTSVIYAASILLKTHSKILLHGFKMLYVIYTCMSKGSTVYEMRLINVLQC